MFSKHLQILAVNGTSLLNLPYKQSLKLLQNTGKTVELTVSQIFHKYQQKLQQKLNFTNANDFGCSINNNSNGANNKSSGKCAEIESNSNNQSEQHKTAAIFLENPLNAYANKDTSTDNDNKLQCFIQNDDGNNNHHYHYHQTTMSIGKIQCNADAKLKNNTVSSMVMAQSKDCISKIRYKNLHEHEQLTHTPFCISSEQKTLMKYGIDNTTAKSNDDTFNRCKRKSDNYLLSAKSMPDLPKVNFRF